MRLLQLPSLLSLLTITHALPRAQAPDDPLPLIVWHGLGDRYDAEGLQSTGKLIQQVHPGTHVYYIRLDDDGSADRTATFFGNVTSQIEQVCEAVLAEPQLRRRPQPSFSSQGREAAVRAEDDIVRVDALGYSQGGQFLRGLVERCPGLSVRSLVTFGSQHNGIAQFQECGDFDFLCKGATALIKGNAWTEYVQGRVVPVQYYRTVDETTGMASREYLEASNFLADVNNEREVKNALYAERIAALEKFVMIVFEDDQTVKPKESGWFAEVNATSGEVTPLEERKIFKEDWLGLKRLQEKDGLVFRTVPGKHMQIDETMLAQIALEFFGPETGHVLKAAQRPAALGPQQQQQPLALGS